MFQYTAKEVTRFTPFTTGSWYFPDHFVLFVSFFWPICSTFNVELSRKFVLSLLWAPRTSPWKKNDAYNCPVVVGRKLHVNNSVTDYFASSSDPVLFFFSPYRQALEIREKTFGKSHPSVATALNNLAVVLCLQVNNVTVVIWLP